VQFVDDVRIIPNYICCCRGVRAEDFIVLSTNFCKGFRVFGKQMIDILYPWVLA